MPSQNEPLPNLILVGCVKSKLNYRNSAKDLYNSPLWRCRRAYAEQAGVPWYILSAKHGLLTPKTRIAPYDSTLADLPAAQRRTWSARVVNDLTEKVSGLQGKVIEIHAGKLYVDYGLEDGLRKAGALVRRPLAHVSGIGPQRRWYAERLASGSAQEGRRPVSRELTTSDTAQLAGLIAGDFYNNRLDLSARGLSTSTAWSQMPEVEYVRQLRASGRSVRSVRLLLTFIAAMDRMRDAARLWRAGVKLFESHSEVFDPDKVLSMPFDTLSALLRANGVSKLHGQDAEAWYQTAASLASRSGAMCRVIDDGVGDARELLKELQSRDRAGRTRFPMLRGPKIGPMWVRMMASPGGAKISHMDTVPVAVDVHVRRVTENLGVTDTRGRKLNNETKREIQSAWRAAVTATSIGGPSRIRNTCAALDPALWFFGKHGCSHCERSKQQLPISRACHHCQLFVSPLAAR